MTNKVMTKKQHYYPRCLLKYFADEYDEVNVYIRQANKLSKVNYERLCFSDYSYESDDTIDNILENKLGHYEAKMGAIVNDILNHFSDEDFTVTREQQEFLYLYMWLQYLRTDAGRINFITMYENIFSHKPRTLPIELTEIKDNQEKIKKFNKLFKQDGVLESYLKNFEKPETMNFHITISEDNLLTSDNPLIGTDGWKRIILPICPCLCIEFIDNSIDEAKTMFIKLTPDHIKYLNEATINTANYFVISNKPFTLSQNNYLYNRFNNKNWTFSKPHFNN
ncbi:hypothetical protein HMPREF9422_1494 [Streptococcus cristatus ATCC 51100]|jgi:hypothetical protein|uniref:DUF4238 domain-containing protein n=2 Tax=Streptococcus cristatus TaxID=45634 RepID=A0AAV3EG32_STRCR|nr:DUF4238 domain-containing protein [Streptococcus cristatus]EFX52354.1 hypothetical protein HMPREF9422_1494 [Streptococcus cristatus ATCC 51100]EGU68406.1 hypothetical protein HMPREF9960_1156 [Streptococcus cristatus ATCC 51100]KJQ60455.1 hypothetical protein TZ85_00510 [Streptococcus cristatus]SQG33227.1 Uncharacterised protein [Streptococcus cristatus ATCC 51100]